jgi:hypothetical protein
MCGGQGNWPKQPRHCHASTIAIGETHEQQINERETSRYHRKLDDAGRILAHLISYMICFTSVVSSPTPLIAPPDCCAAIAPQWPEHGKARKGALIFVDNA